MKRAAGSIFMFCKIVGIKAPERFILFFSHKINVNKKIKIVLQNAF